MSLFSVALRLILIIISTAIAFLLALIAHYLLPYQYRAFIVKYWAISMLKIAGAKLIIVGAKLDHYVNSNHMVIANHISWLDIPILYSQYFVNFVGRVETKSWPILNWVIKLGGTIFVDRSKKRQLLRVNHELAHKLRHGACIGLFPEGKTSTGQKVLPFKSSILEAAILAQSTILPIAISFYRRDGRVAYSVSYAGKVNLWQTVTRSLLLRGFVVKIHLLEPIASADFTSREQLSLHLQQRISQGRI